RQGGSSSLVPACWPSERPHRRCLNRQAAPGTAFFLFHGFFSATSEWIQFFKEAGIPPGPAVNYAVMFVDNRIQKNMLMDLNKEIMNELGITVVGDIIAILKHAKIVYRQVWCTNCLEIKG
uniref:Uncharacterized protein n=1 Tax=Buteo japonicus TaxID=224669 RepID=A0A8B9Z793_9AVES